MTTLSSMPDAACGFKTDDALIAWIGERLIGQDDPDAVMQPICAALGRHLGVAIVGIGEVDHAASSVVVPWDWVDGVPSARGTHPFHADFWHMREYVAGRTVVYADWADMPLLPAEAATMLASECRATICVPIVRKDTLEGMFNVADRVRRAWTPDEIALVERIARLLGATIDHARTLRRLRDSEELFRTLADNMPGVCWVSGPEGRAFWMNREGLELYGATGIAADNAEQLVHPDDQANVMAQWATARANGTPIEMTVRMRLSGEQYRPYISRAAPIRDTAGTVVRWAGVQLDLTEERLRMRGEELLRRLSDATRELDDAEAILDVSTEMLGRHLGVGRVALSDTDPNEADVYRVRRDWTDGTVPSVVGRIPLGQVLPEVAAHYRTGRTLVTNDIQDNKLLSPETVAALQSRCFRSGISVPLVRDGRVVAVLAIQNAQPRLWSEDEVRLVEDVAERTWATLARAQVERELQERERMQAVLLAWSDAVRAEASPRAILAQTLRTIGKELGVARVNFAEAAGDGQVLVVEQDWTDGVASVAGQQFPLSALGATVVAEHLRGVAFRTDDAHADPRFDATTLATYDAVGARAFVSIPLIRGDRLVAVLSMQHPRPRRWRDDEVSLLSEMAERTRAILERARSEERLAESEALLAAYLAHAPIAMYLKDAEGRYILVNDEMAKMLDVSPAQAIGRTAFELSDRDLATRVAELDRAALSGGVQSGILDFGDRDTYQTLLSIRFPIPSRSGGPARLGGFALDLTDQTRAETALQRSRDALYQSEKLTALGSLLAGVSHELNNPLSIVVAQSVMMERHAAGGPLADRAYKIRKAADRCARIVQTFLAMARQREPERRAVDLSAVAAAAVELADYGLRTDGIEVQLALAPDLPRIAADADQLHQIIINLIVNAQQAMVEGVSPVRRLTLATASGRERGTVVLDIMDTGPGVPPAARRRIFEPFYTTKPQGEGTGVGLSFSQGLVEAHGGRLELVDSASGAHFRLTLPIEATGPVAAVVEPLAVSAPVVARRALIVDDEREIAESLSDFLSLEGFACDIADGGDAAIVRLSGGTPYDLVVSDLRMPGTDGPGLYAWIKDHRADMTQRIAFATGDTLGTAVSRFIAEAGRPVLEKPFMPDGVRRLLRQMEA